MPPKVDMAARRALDAAAAARQAEKKKRPAAEAGQYQLKRIRRGPPPLAPRSPPTRTSPAVLEAIPLVGGSAAAAVHLEATGGSLPEPARESIRPTLLFGEARRFEIMSLQELGDWAYCFASSASILLFLFPWQFSLDSMF